MVSDDTTFCEGIKSCASPVAQGAKRDAQVFDSLVSGLTVSSFACDWLVTICTCRFRSFIYLVPLLLEVELVKVFEAMHLTVFGSGPMHVTIRLDQDWHLPQSGRSVSLRK